MEMTLERAYCGVLTLTVATYSQSTTFPSGCMCMGSVRIFISSWGLITAGWWRVWYIGKQAKVEEEEK